MNVIQFNYETHSSDVMKWLSKHSFPLPPKDMLPLNTGFIVEGTACAFLYVTNSNLGWIEWVFSNPEKPKEERAEALDALFKRVEKEAEYYSITVLFSAASIPGYAKVLDRNGFKETDKNVTHFVKLLGEK